MYGPKAVIAEALVYSLALLATLAGCGEPPPVDRSLLTGEPCEPPCWQGLVPGVSTEEEVDEFLQGSELVDQPTIFRGDITLGTGEVVGVTVQWWSRSDMAGAPRQFGNDFSIQDGVLQDMMVFVDYEVTLEELLSRYGEPHKWSSSWVSLHIPDVDVKLYYPNHGLTAWLRLPADDAWLRPENKVRRVRYSRVVSLGDFLQLGPEIGYFLPGQEEALRDWQGYGIACF